MLDVCVCGCVLDVTKMPNVWENAISKCKTLKKEKEKLKNPGDQVIVTQFNVLRAQLLFSSFATACASSGAKRNEGGGGMVGWKKTKKNLPRGTASPWGEEGDRSRLMSYGTAPRGGCMALMTVQSLAFGGYMLGAAELWFEVHMQKGGGLGRVGWQTGSSQSAKSDTQAAAAEGASAGTTKHLYLLKDSTIAPQTEKTQRADVNIVA